MDNDTLSALSLLGYSPHWVEYGFLEADVLQAKVAYYRAGHDNNTEHYRYAAFRQILATRTALDDAQVADYVALALQDGDPGVGTSALCLLIDWEGLTAQQLGILRREPAFDTRVLQKRLTRRQLMDALTAEPLTAEVFARCLASGDSFVQRELVETADLLPSQLEVLANQGANRAIRNLAKQRLKRG